LGVQLIERGAKIIITASITPAISSIILTKNTLQLAFQYPAGEIQVRIQELFFSDYLVETMFPERYFHKELIWSPWTLPLLSPNCPNS
jgi:hypothetical protein